MSDDIQKVDEGGIMASSETTCDVSQPSASGQQTTSSIPNGDTPSSATPKSRTACGVCNKEPSKYKCSRCPLSYCSVPCARIHRDNHPPDEPRPPPQPAIKEAKSPSHPFSILDGSIELQQLFRRYPKLPDRLKEIHDTTLPPDEEGLLQGGLPTKATLAYMQNQKKSESWTRDVGLRRGQQALRKARTDPGEIGDGVREYCELVIYLLSKAKQEAVATELVRQEAAMEDAKLIEQLMKTESR